MILTGGVHISDKEVEYTMDAVTNGWDEHHSDYIHRFEKEFARYVGSKYSYAVTGGTQALWLSLAGLDIGPADEVIIPDITYFACSDVTVLRGARPVFVDVDPVTWCMDPEKLKNAITDHTRAIMPVWLYGNAPDMDEIMDIAGNIPVIEDSCPAAGSRYKGQHAGTFGRTGCFSFHGAKIMTTGFGGMVVSDDKDLMDRIRHMDDHGEDKSNPRRFIQKDIGYSFYMHNINAAFGLGQLQNLDSFVTKKRKIYKWYKNILGNIDGLSMNEEPQAHTNRWLTSIVLDREFNVDRDTLMKKLHDDEIDTRPFFSAISTFDLYQDTDTPVSHHLGLNGINLPSGVQRTEDEITKIALLVKKHLCG